MDYILNIFSLNRKIVVVVLSGIFLIYNCNFHYKRMLNEDILNDLDDLDSAQQQQDSLNRIDEDDEDDQMAESKHSQLLNNLLFKEHMATIAEIIDHKIQKGKIDSQKSESTLIQKSNEYASTISKQINSIFRFVKNVYNRKFPELQSIITQPSLYCKAVRQIQQFEIKNIDGVSKTSLPFNYLSNHQRISLQIALSSLHQKLPQSETLSLIESTTTVVILHEHHNVLMMYLESCMQLVAPNLCQLVGSLIASKLISTAGGIKELSSMPACNIQVMGGQRTAQIGLNMVERNHTGIFGQMDVVRDTPPNYKMQLVRMMASNTAKCARADFLKSQKGLGARLREDMLERFQKIQDEGGLHRIDQPLPIPDQEPKKKRGGKRFRKMKDLYQLSDLRKQQNRLKFGQQAEVEIQDGVGLGMLSQGIGKLKVNIKKQKLKVSKKMNERMNKKSGLQSSLNLGASSGMQLINPALQNNRQGGKQTIFSKSAGFQTVLNNKFGSYK